MKTNFLTKSIKYGVTLSLSTLITLNMNAQMGYSSSSVMMNRQHSTESHGQVHYQTNPYATATAHHHHGHKHNQHGHPHHDDAPYWQYTPVQAYKMTGVTASNQVVVEEYMNFHEHEINHPDGEIPLALDLRWSSEEFYPGESVLQIGIASESMKNLNKIKPLNISLVIDRSGSMASDDKMNKVKRALREFAKALRPEDKLNIITYSSTAELVFSNFIGRGDFARIENAINRIYPSGSTNLNAGMEMGYREVQKNFSPEFTNKVILLTDGIANTGVTQPYAIVRNSQIYNQEGIDISTIGVGSNLNHTLLADLAKAGKGSNYFIGNDEEDIQKVFKDELQSLLSPIAIDVKLVIEYPQGLRLKKFFGYSPSYRGNTITVDLNNINAGLTQVFLMQFDKNSKAFNENEMAPINAYLQYTDVKTQERTELYGMVAVPEKEAGRFNRHRWEDDEVKKNYYIAYMAEQLKLMAANNEQGRFSEGQAVLSAALHEVNHEFSIHRDKDLKRIYDILKDNQAKMELFCTHYHTHPNWN